MVDAAEIVEARETRTRKDASATSATAGITCELHPFDRESYAAFCAVNLHSAPQNPAFVAAWKEEVGADIITVLVGRNRQTIMMLPLEIVREGFATVARYPGGRHANGSFPAWCGPQGIDLRSCIVQAFKNARPEVDLVLLERNEEERAGRPNPLRGPGCVKSPNIALAVDLAGGFDAALERSSGKRKRKKHRSQVRKFETVGPHNRYQATTPEQVDALLSAFYEMKSERFRHMGIADVFAPDGVRRAFRRMFVEALDRNAPDFVLHGLEVAGVPRAVTGSSISGGRMTCEFSAFSNDELSFASPGDFLFYENVQEACENGLAIYDFGVGDEPYKRQWCNIETQHFDFHLPVSARGALISASRRATASLKRGIKENQRLWAMLKRLRKSGAGKATPNSGNQSED